VFTIIVSSGVVQADTFVGNRVYILVTYTVIVYHAL